MKRLFPILLGIGWLAPAIAAESLGNNLEALLVYAREHNQELIAARFEADAAQQRSAAAGTLADPVLRTELMDIKGQGAPGTRFLLMQSVPWSGKRDTQRAVAAAQASLAEGQVAVSWAELTARIKVAYTMHYVAVANEHLIQQSMMLLDSIGQISQTRYANGIGAQQDVIQAQVEKTLLQSELLAVQSEQHHTHIRLNTLLARPVNAPLAEPAELRVVPDSSVLDEAALLERLRANNPQLRAATANSQASEKNRELVLLNRYPDFTLGVAPTLIGGATKSWDTMIEVTIPLQQFARRAQEREAEAMLVAANARQEALLNQVQAELSENLSELEASRRTEILIAGRLLPQAELSYQAALAAYETGKAGFTALMEAQRQALKVRQQKLQAQADMQLRLVEIEKLLGASL